MSMAQAFPRDPLHNYQFRVGLLDGAGGEGGAEYVAGVQKVSGLNVSIAAAEAWSGGNNLQRYANPDKANWDPITLEQGLALSSTLEDWAQAALEFLGNGRKPVGGPLKRNCFIDVWDPHLYRRGQGGAALSEPGRVRRYFIFNAWISRFHALPQLDAMANEVALLSVELIHEGWRLAQDSDALPGSFEQFRPLPDSSSG